MTKRIVVPIEKATNVTLYEEHYDVVDGKIEVPNSVARRVLEDPELQHAAGHGKLWAVEEGRNSPADKKTKEVKESDEPK